MGTVLISFAIYFGIASGMVIINGKPKQGILGQNQLLFEELKIDYSDIPPLDTFLCRDETNLDYRYYPSKSETLSFYCMVLPGTANIFFL